MEDVRRWYDTETLKVKTGSKGSVFIVCDPGLRDLYHAIQIENEAVEIHSFMEALEHYRNAAPDLVIIDCTYHEDSCAVMIAEMKAIASHVPIIFISETTEVLPDALFAGARIALRKPINIITLQGIALKLLKIKRISREKRSSFIPPETILESRNVSATTDKPVTILRIIQYIEKNYSEKINLDALAREANLSKYHFCRYFMRYTGMSPMRFVTYKRIERAKEFLKRKDQTVSIVSFLAGFNDLGTFIRQFKQATGLTPSVYQHSLLPDQETLRQNPE